MRTVFVVVVPFIYKVMIMAPVLTLAATFMEGEETYFRIAGSSVFITMYANVEKACHNGE